MPFAVKGKCQHCGQPIEFPDDRAGETAPCPNCGMETLLYAPPKTAPPPKTATSKPNPSTVGLRIVNGILLIVSLGLIFIGCLSGLDEMTSKDGSAIRGTEAAVQYGSGFILLAVCLVIDAIIRLLRK